MYSISRKKVVKKKWKFKDFESLCNLDGFLMPSSRNGFNICNQKITYINVVDIELAKPIVRKFVSTKYKKLIKTLTELLISDDDSGDTFRLALDKIEKFRMEVKNKYRRFLEQKELEIMAKQLSALQKQAKLEFAELQNNLLSMNEMGKGK
ncbi:MAG: hypothetical protein UE699_01030 [Bacilli bacterium]|nr:hypothetical protein [Mycoplasmatota bacterium]MDD6264311.1 hypothetical protein [bacterium]MDY2696669.1 hypothetical protein [Bacilli bacterium]MDD6942174.1 hypothetical protein [bacterium]MDY5993237.1 hypothetical protein [Bacilli bacterium]